MASLAALGLAALLVGAGAVLGAWGWVASSPGPSAAGPAGTETEPEADLSGSAQGWRPWERNDDGRPVRWDPCTPIELVVAPRGAYRGFVTDLQAAVDEIEELTGLPLVVRGEVEEEPAADRRAYQPERYGERWAPVLVAFARPGEHDLPIIDVDRGLGAPVAVGAPGDRTYVTGQIVFNVERGDLVAGAGQRSTSWGATVRHELGHLLGLAHVEDEDQLMHPHPGEGPVAWGRGDRRGLEALAAGGCRQVPTPRPVDVELGELRP